MLISDVLSAFRKGKELANAATWKNRAIAANALGVFLTAVLGIAAAFGYNLDIDAQTVQTIAEGLAAGICLLNVGVHVTTSERVGLPAKPEASGPAAADGGGTNLPLDAG